MKLLLGTQFKRKSYSRVDKRCLLHLYYPSVGTFESVFYNREVYIYIYSDKQG